MSVNVMSRYPRMKDWALYANTGYCRERCVRVRNCSLYGFRGFWYAKRQAWTRWTALRSSLRKMASSRYFTSSDYWISANLVIKISTHSEPPFSTFIDMALLKFSLFHSSSKSWVCSVVLNVLWTACASLSRFGDFNRTFLKYNCLATHINMIQNAVPLSSSAISAWSQRSMKWVNFGSKVSFVIPL